MLHGSDIGKIEIYDDYSIVAVPSATADEVIDMMYGAKVCGKPVKTRLFEEKLNRSERRSKKFDDGKKKNFSPKNSPKHSNKKSPASRKNIRRNSKRQG